MTVLVDKQLQCWVKWQVCQDVLWVTKAVAVTQAVCPKQCLSQLAPAWLCDTCRRCHVCHALVCASTTLLAACTAMHPMLSAQESTLCCNQLLLAATKRYSWFLAHVAQSKPIPQSPLLQTVVHYHSQLHHTYDANRAYMASVLCT